MSWLFGTAEVEFTYKPETVKLPLRSTSKDNGPENEQSLSDLCREVTPACQLNPLLFNGHLRTISAVLKKNPVDIYYRRRIFESDDEHYPGSFVVDFVHHPLAEAKEDSEPGRVEKESDPTLFPRTRYFRDEEWSNFPSDDDTPMLVTCHGISGGSQELYLREGIAPLVLPKDGTLRRWECCVVTARGCGKSKLTSDRIFNARATWDLRQVVKWLRANFPNRPLFGLGFSLGANILSNYVGEEGDQCELNAAIAMSNPWNLEGGGLALQRSWMGLEVYSKTMATSLKKIVEKNWDQLSKNPDISLEKIKKAKYLHEFDEALQCPSWGYPTTGAYYRDASSTDPLLNIRIPFMIVHARDDPVTPDECLPRKEVEQNPYATLVTTTLGGHLGWVEVGGGRWFVKPINNFMRKFGEEIDLAKLKALKNSNGVQVPYASRPSYNPLSRKLAVQS